MSSRATIGREDVQVISAFESVCQPVYLLPWWWGSLTDWARVLTPSKKEEKMLHEDNELMLMIEEYNCVIFHLNSVILILDRCKDKCQAVNIRFFCAASILKDRSVGTGCPFRNLMHSKKRKDVNFSRILFVLASHCVLFLSLNYSMIITPHERRV